MKDLIIIIVMIFMFSFLIVKLINSIDFLKEQVKVLEKRIDYLEKK